MPDSHSPAEEATKYKYDPGPDDDETDQQVVIYYLLKRERTPEKDRLTPRMQAYRVLKALDESRRAR